MKYKLLLTIFFSITLYANAQSKKEKQVARAVEQLRVAMIKGDPHLLGAITSEKLSYGHSGGLVEDRKTFTEKLTSGKSDFVTIDLTDQTISVSKKTALVRHVLNAKTNDNNVPGEVHLKILLVFQKVHGKWILLARQAVKM